MQEAFKSLTCINYIYMITKTLLGKSVNLRLNCSFVKYTRLATGNLQYKFQWKVRFTYLTELCLNEDEDKLQYFYDKNVYIKITFRVSLEAFTNFASMLSLNILITFVIVKSLRKKKRFMPYKDSNTSSSFYLVLPAISITRNLLDVKLHISWF